MEFALKIIDLLLGKTKAAEIAAQLAKRPQSETAGAPERARTVSLASLPKEGAIVWGATSGQTVTVFSDFGCGYCRALAGVLAELGVMRRQIGTKRHRGRWYYVLPPFDQGLDAMARALGVDAERLLGRHD